MVTQICGKTVVETEIVKLFKVPSEGKPAGVNVDVVEPSNMSV